MLDASMNRGNDVIECKVELEHNEPGETLVAL